jgi:hypothetical protein
MTKKRMKVATLNCCQKNAPKWKERDFEHLKRHWDWNRFNKCCHHFATFLKMHICYENISNTTLMGGKNMWQKQGQETRKNFIEGGWCIL